MRLLAACAIASMLSSGCMRPMLTDGSTGPSRGNACAVGEPCWSGSGGDVDGLISVAVAGAILVAVTIELARRL